MATKKSKAKKGKAKAKAKAKVRVKAKAKTRAKVNAKSPIKAKVKTRPKAEVKPRSPGLPPERPVHLPKPSAGAPPVSLASSGHGSGATGEKTRYSPAELAEFRQIILEKLQVARKEYETIMGTISHQDDQSTDDTSPTFKILEEGADVLSKEANAQLASRQKKFIEHLEQALVRIENGTYGLCRITGKLISKERLRAVPHATLSIEAKQKQVR